MADTSVLSGVTLSPPPFREQLSYVPTQLLTSVWQRWMDLWWQQHTALWKQGQGGTWQPLDPTLSALAALTGTGDTFPYFSGTDVMALTGLSPYSRTLLDDPDAGTWRSTLGLGTLSTANAPLTVAQGGTGATDAATARTNLGLGTMSIQNANAVAMTGGTATLSTLTTAGLVQSAGGVQSLHRAVDGVSAFSTDQNSGTNRYAFQASGTALSSFGGPVQVAGPALYSTTVQVVGSLGLGVAPSASVRLALEYDKSTGYGLSLRQTTDTGGGTALLFQNAAGTIIGSISTTGAATAYNTSSDARLKDQVTPVRGALARVRALRPVAFRWKADGSPGVGFLAHEVMTVVPEAVTGEPDAVHDDGSIRPQQVDYSRLVPHVTAAIHELLARVIALEEQLAWQ